MKFILFGSRVKCELSHIVYKYAVAKGGQIYASMQKLGTESEHESEERKKKRVNSKKYNTHASNTAHFGATRGENSHGMCELACL